MSDIVEKLRKGITGFKSYSAFVAVTPTHIEAADEIEKLRAALRRAIDAVEFWASYASPYFQEKHDLAKDLQELRAALGEKE